jgi:hypothetical protein
MSLSPQKRCHYPVSHAGPSVRDQHTLVTAPSMTSMPHKFQGQRSRQQTKGKDKSQPPQIHYLSAGCSRGIQENTAGSVYTWSKHPQSCRRGNIPLVRSRKKPEIPKCRALSLSRSFAIWRVDEIYWMEQIRSKSTSFTPQRRTNGVHTTVLFRLGAMLYRTSPPLVPTRKKPLSPHRVTTGGTLLYKPAARTIQLTSPSIDGLWHLRPAWMAERIIASGMA